MDLLGQHEYERIGSEVTGWRPLVSGYDAELLLFVSLGNLRAQEATLCFDRHRACRMSAVNSAIQYSCTNWRVPTKKINETMYAECKLCSDGKCYIGNMGSFSNCSCHVARKHAKELEIFVKSNKSDPKQPSITFTIPLVIAKRKQTELEKIMGKLFIHENIPLNLVQS